jgi:hypothetical protein
LGLVIVDFPAISLDTEESKKKDNSEHSHIWNQSTESTECLIKFFHLEKKKWTEGGAFCHQRFSGWSFLGVNFIIKLNSIISISDIWLSGMFVAEF